MDGDGFTTYLICRDGKEPNFRSAHVNETSFPACVEPWYLRDFFLFIVFHPSALLPMTLKDSEGCTIYLQLYPIYLGEYSMGLYLYSISLFHQNKIIYPVAKNETINILIN